MSQSKISKIETGFYTQLVPSEIEYILNILDAPRTISQQILLVIEGGTRQYITRKLTPAWKDAATVLKREHRATLLRMFLFQSIPVALQTSEYRHALMEQFGQNSPHNDTAMRRQDLLWDGHHTYHIILHELSLYTILSSRRVHRAQLDRLERFIGSEYVKLGIIPLEAGMFHFENSSFVIYDERLAVALTGTIEIDFEAPLDITKYLRMFDTIRKKACYDVEARDLIHKAIDYFNQI